MRRHAPLALAASLSIAASLLLALPAAAVPDEPAPPSAPSLSSAGTIRFAGIDRYATATAVSNEYAPHVPVLFIAAGTDFPDALSAAAAAALLGGPLLLTPTHEIPEGVYAEIQRLQPDEIIVVGGASVVHQALVETFSTLAPTRRLSGVDRYATGLAIVEDSFSSATDAVIATGLTFPDALAATGAAGSIGAPVILVDGSRPTVPQGVIDTLHDLGVTNVHIAGSSGAVSPSIELDLESHGFEVARYGGADRYATAAAINDAFFAPGSTEGAALAGALGAPLYITEPGCVPGAVRESVATLSPSQVVVMGGTSVVGEAAASNVGCLVSSIPTITGTAKALSTLDVDAGPWTTGAWLTFAWYADGVQVGTGTALTVPSSLVGKRITVQVTGELPGYATVTRTSKATAPVTR
jgi:putative cell wall-binding protein